MTGTRRGNIRPGVDAIDWDRQAVSGQGARARIKVLKTDRGTRTKQPVREGPSNGGQPRIPRRGQAPRIVRRRIFSDSSKVRRPMGIIKRSPLAKGSVDFGVRLLDARDAKGVRWQGFNRREKGSRLYGE